MVADNKRFGFQKMVEIFQSWMNTSGVRVERGLEIGLTLIDICFTLAHKLNSIHVMFLVMQTSIANSTSF